MIEVLLHRRLPKVVAVAGATDSRSLERVAIEVRKAADGQTLDHSHGTPRAGDIGSIRDDDLDLPSPHRPA